MLNRRGRLLYWSGRSSNAEVHSMMNQSYLATLKDSNLTRWMAHSYPWPSTADIDDPIRVPHGGEMLPHLLHASTILGWLTLLAPEPADRAIVVCSCRYSFCRIVDCCLSGRLEAFVQLAFATLRLRLFMPCLHVIEPTQCLVFVTETVLVLHGDLRGFSTWIQFVRSTVIRASANFVVFHRCPGSVFFIVLPKVLHSLLHCWSIDPCIPKQKLLSGDECSNGC